MRCPATRAGETGLARTVGERRNISHTPDRIQKLDYFTAKSMDKSQTLRFRKALDDKLSHPTPPVMAPPLVLLYSSNEGSVQGGGVISNVTSGSVNIALFALHVRKSLYFVRSPVRTTTDLFSVGILRRRVGAVLQQSDGHLQVPAPTRQVQRMPTAVVERLRSTGGWYQSGRLIDWLIGILVGWFIPRGEARHPPTPAVDRQHREDSSRMIKKNRGKIVGDRD